MNDTLKACIKEKKTSYTPIWFMRQAGRYLPEFREIRKKNLNFIDLCLNTNLISDITLQLVNLRENNLLQRIYAFVPFTSVPLTFRTA